MPESNELGTEWGGQRAVRLRGRLGALSEEELSLLLNRSTSRDETVRSRTAEIVERVRVDGDRALRELAQELDGVSLAALEVPMAECERALDRLETPLREALERSARNLATAHEAFRPVAAEIETEPGVVVGRRPDALARVGVYAPGGRAAYASSVLMGVVPARIAGVAEIVVCSPPGADGLPPAVVLAAAALGGAHRIFAIGGAGAVAAMAYGTESVPRVDRIAGPGNAYVAEAKLQLCGVVGIDVPAGPSELLVIADFSADPALVAREMLAQAEHDPMSAVVAVMLGDEAAEQVETTLVRMLPEQPRGDIVAAALLSRGAVLVAQDYDAAIVFANAYAPEHLLLAVAEPDAEAVLARVRNAGAVFVGESSSVVFGDYITGANHVLPTGGLARSYSGLSTADFVRWTTYQRVTAAAAATLAPDVARLAECEQLPGHASAARYWADPERGEVM